MLFDTCGLLVQMILIEDMAGILSIICLLKVKTTVNYSICIQ